MLGCLDRHEEQNGPSIWAPKQSKGGPLDSLLSSINEGASPDNPLYWHEVVFIDSSHWLDTPRERIYILLVHSDLGRSVLESATRIISAVKASAAVTTSFHELLLPDNSMFLATKLAELQAQGICTVCINVFYVEVQDSRVQSL